MPKSDYVNEKGYGPKKGEKRTGKVAGSRLAYDDTPDSKKSPGAAATRKKGVTTKKGMARKGEVAGARLAYDDTPAKIRWIDHVKAVQKKEGGTYKEAMTSASKSWKK
jgi:hypothetical protein